MTEEKENAAKHVSSLWPSENYSVDQALDYVKNHSNLTEVLVIGYSEDSGFLVSIGGKNGVGGITRKDALWMLEAAKTRAMMPITLGFADEYIECTEGGGDDGAA